MCMDVCVSHRRHAPHTSHIAYPFLVRFKRNHLIIAVLPLSVLFHFILGDTGSGQTIGRTLQKAKCESAIETAESFQKECEVH